MVFFSFLVLWQIERNYQTAVSPERPVCAVSIVNVDLLVCKVSQKAVKDVRELQALADELWVTDGWY